MLAYNLLTKDQLAAIDRLYENDITYLVAGMGFGKSVVTLTAVDELLENEVCKRVLIVAPLKACNDVWKTEYKKWEHLTHMDIEHATGTVIKRKKAIESGAEVVVINIDNFVWLLDEYPDHNFDGLVMDELSKYKDGGTKLVKKLRRATKKFKWKVGMTGTPVHETFAGLYAQMLALDGGVTFGTNKEKFLKNYFYPTDFDEYNWELKDGSEKLLINKMAPCLHVAPDYTGSLPDLHEIVIGFDMPKIDFDAYGKFAKNSVTHIKGVEIVAENAAVLSGKLCQFASGFLYTEDGGKPETTHNARIVKFNSLLTSVSRSIICYWYTAELAYIKELLDVKCINYCSMDDPNAVEKWNNKEVDYLLLHPASAGHGLNLAQGGSNMIFFSPIWSNDVSKQTIARIWRRGQTEECNVYTLSCNKTIDALKLQGIVDKEDYDVLFHRHVDSFL